VEALVDDAVPVILITEPNGDAAPAVREIRERYGPRYSILIATTAEHGIAELDRLADAADEVALVLADRATDGRGVLRHTRVRHPQARRGLLLEFNDSRANREEIADAFARRDVEGFVTKPIADPDERFHRSIVELLDEWWRLHGSADAGICIVGPERAPRVSEICDVLQRHDIPFTLEPAGSDAGRAVLEQAGVTADTLPVIVLRSGEVLVDPTNIDLANALGARTRPGEGVYDLIVVGGGPAGLSAAVYAESEGLRTALVEAIAMGGQAGTSSMIRNYLGFPRGISGAELAARAFEQAILFGTEMVYGNSVVGLAARGELRVVTLADGTEIPGRAVVIATGVSYRRLGIPELEALNGSGVFYGAAMSEAASLTGERAFVVGGGNSAGQAAVYLARFAERVTLLVRGETLAASMSEYLITEIDSTPNIEVRYCTEIIGGGGRGRLEQLELRDRRSGERTTVPAAAVFVLIGAEPLTDWLPPEVERDEWGYIVTGSDGTSSEGRLFESRLPGVFAVGDVRRGSIKRVASAVGEGAVCVRVVHDYLARDT
jgi:thioredoxin reductase (NADPH)